LTFFHLSAFKAGWLFAALALLFSCQSDPQPPDVSHIKIETELVRYDQFLIEWDSSSRVDDFTSYKEQYPGFTNLYLHRILNLPRANDTTIHEELVRIATAPPIQALMDSVAIRYEDMSDIQSEFSSAFRYYKYYFPNFSTPDVYTCLTEFAVATFLFEDENGEDALGLSLDMYLGAQFPYHLLAQRETTFSKYLIRTFNKDHMVKKALEVLINDKTQNMQDERLLDYMVDHGRTLYIVKQLIPTVPDSVLFEFTADQVSWCNNNELNMWAHILDEELLYSRELKKINTLIRPAPTSMGMPSESPGRSGNFIGYQIVEQFMRNTGTTLPELIAFEDPQEILNASKYKGQNIN
jgi:hypothetical protein